VPPGVVRRLEGGGCVLWGRWVVGNTRNQIMFFNLLDSITGSSTFRRIPHFDRRTNRSVGIRK